MKLKLNQSVREYIDQVRGFRCRADYILKCVSYIRDNNIDINNYYEGNINHERADNANQKRENTDKL